MKQLIMKTYYPDGFPLRFTMSPSSPQEQPLNPLLMEIEHLRQEVIQLKQDNQDLQIALDTIAEHGDIIESELHQTNQQLTEEIAERRRAESMLKMLLDMISSERNDLEIVVQTLMDHGDSVDFQWREKLRESDRLAMLDGLTGIPNRRKFDEYLGQQWRQMSREQSSLSLLLCDIDCFKQYNDAYGHLAGDDCIKQVAGAIFSTLKRPIDLVARYGGEEFAAILPQTSLLGARAVAEQIQEKIYQLHIPHAQSSVRPYLTLSIGLSSAIPQYTDSPNLLLTQADQQLYLAKQRGRNRIVSN